MKKPTRYTPYGDDDYHVYLISEDGEQTVTDEDFGFVCLASDVEKLEAEIETLRLESVGVTDGEGIIKTHQTMKKPKRHYGIHHYDGHHDHVIYKKCKDGDVYIADEVDAYYGRVIEALRKWRSVETSTASMADIASAYDSLENCCKQLFDCNMLSRQSSSAMDPNMKHGQQKAHLRRRCAYCKGEFFAKQRNAIYCYDDRCRNNRTVESAKRRKEDEKDYHNLHTD